MFHDRTGQSAEKEMNLRLDAFPSPGDLWARYRAWKGFDTEAEQIVLQDYFEDGSGKPVFTYSLRQGISEDQRCAVKGRSTVVSPSCEG